MIRGAESRYVGSLAPDHGLLRFGDWLAGDRPATGDWLAGGEHRWRRDQPVASRPGSSYHRDSPNPYGGSGRFRGATPMRLPWRACRVSCLAVAVLLALTSCGNGGDDATAAGAQPRPIDPEALAKAVENSTALKTDLRRFIASVGAGETSPDVEDAFGFSAVVRSGRGMDPIELIKELQTSVDFREVGTDSIAGVSTTHYTGSRLSRVS